jgi:nicotinamide mononucleotide transporter
VSPFEIVAAAFGITSVFLSARQNVLSWPTSLVNNVMYVVHFLGLKLYALMALNGIFALIAIYGWYGWMYGGANRTALRVTRTPPRLAAVLAGLILAAWAAIWFVLERYTQDPAPGMDGFFFAGSLTAQWMMARKYYECWWMWVGLNILAVPFFYLQKSYPTMVQYAVFLVLAIQGWRFWKASLAVSGER